MGTFSTLSRYIGRQFILWFSSLLMVLLGVIALFELIEMLRRTSGEEGVTFAMALQLTLLKLPQTVEVLFHFAVLFSAMYTYWRLTRSQELVVARATGVSAWQFLWPVVIIATLIGGFKIGIFNPVAAAMYARYELLEDRYLHGRTNLLDISGGGIWLRQRTDDGFAVISAERTAPDKILLSDVVILLFDEEERYLSRIDAETAELHPGFWEVQNAHHSVGTSPAVFMPVYRLASELTPTTIQESFASPGALSFWDLPDFITALEETGFSSLRHRLHYHAMLAQPLLMAAMVLFAATFSLRHTRRGGTLAMVVAGVLTGFVLFVMNDVMIALGLSENVPVEMAAWTPASVSALIGIAMLLHLEDG